MDWSRHTGGFPAQQNDILCKEAEIDVRRCRPCCGKHQPPAGTIAPCLKCGPITVVHHRRPVEIIKAGALERPVIKPEPGGSDNMNVNPQTGAKPQQSAGVLRNIGLVERKGGAGAQLIDWIVPSVGTEISDARLPKGTVPGVQHYDPN